MKRRIKVEDSQKTFLGCVGIILVACLLCGGCFVGCSVATNYEYSSGFRDGSLVKLSTKGIFFKSHEGELATDGFKARGSTESNLWEFSVSDAEIVKELTEMPTGTRLRLHYSQKLCHLPWVSSTEYFVTKVEKK